MMVTRQERGLAIDGAYIHVSILVGYLHSLCIRIDH